MALSGFLFISWRIFEIITLTPIVGMLGWFVSKYDGANVLTPDYILVLFIVSVLALAWAFFTLIQYYRARHDAFFVALIDLGFVGALIGSVVVMRRVASSNCTTYGATHFYGNSDFGVYGPDININKTCAMLKASFAFAIINIIAFFVTFCLALLVHRHHRKEDRVVVKREVHTSRHGHRRSSSRDQRGSRDYGYSSRPRASSRSHYSSSRRTYV